MSNIYENEYDALVDALKNMADVVAVLSNKINSQDDEILKLKKNNSSLEELVNKINDKMQNLKIKSTNYSNIELKTDEEKEDTDENKQYSEHFNDDSTNPIITDPTTIGETDINNLRKNKAIQIVDKLIQKKKEISILIQNNEDKKIIIDKEQNNDNTEKLNLITKRKNKIMRRF
jgi:hypothetical protein